MKNYRPYTELKKELLSDPEVKKYYDELEPEYRLVRSIIDKRLQKKMSQAELAQRVGTRQSAISRLESGNANPSIQFLKKVASALNASLEIKFRPLR